MEKFFTVKEAAEFMRISPLTVNRVLNSGELKGYKFGGQWRIEKSDILKYGERKKERVFPNLGLTKLGFPKIV